MPDFRVKVDDEEEDDNKGNDMEDSPEAVAGLSLKREIKKNSGKKERNQGEEKRGIWQQIVWSDQIKTSCLLPALSFLSFLFFRFSRTNGFCGFWSDPSENQAEC
jgi:hypothetical protein